MTDILTAMVEAYNDAYFKWLSDFAHSGNFSAKEAREKAGLRAMAAACRKEIERLKADKSYSGFKAREIIIRHLTTVAEQAP